MDELLQKVNRNEKSICGKCIHRFVCFGTKNQPCFECNRFMEELVRCKDCKHMAVVGIGYRWCKAWERIQTMGDDGFCCFGERRTDA